MRAGRGGGGGGAGKGQEAVRGRARAWGGAKQDAAEVYRERRPRPALTVSPGASAATTPPPPPNALRSVAMCRVSQMWAAVVVVVVLVVATDLGAVAEAKPDPSQLANMAEALKYLQELDKYYSQVSRPRYDPRLTLSLSASVAPAAGARSSFLSLWTCSLLRRLSLKFLNAFSHSFYFSLSLSFLPLAIRLFFFSNSELWIC